MDPSSQVPSSSAPDLFEEREQPLQEQTARISTLSPEGVAPLIHELDGLCGSLRAQNAELRASEKKYRQLIEELEGGIWAIDQNAVTTFVNGPMAAMLGYTADEMLGKHLICFMDEAEMEFCRECLRRRRQGIKEQHNFKFRQKDGTPLYARLATAPILNDCGEVRGALALVLDVSDRHETGEALWLSEMRFRTLADHNPDIITRFDRMLRYLYVNPAIQTATGLSPEAFLGKTNRDLGIPEDLCRQWEQKLEDAFAGNRTTLEFSFDAPDGQIRHYQSLLVPEFDPDGSVPTVLGITRDITELRRSEELLHRKRSLLDNVMRTTDVMLVLLDPRFNFLWVNSAYAETCRREPEEMIGKNHFDLYPHEENEAIFRKVRDTGAGVFYKDKPFVYPDQPERGVTYWDWSLTPVKDTDGSVTSLVFSLRETTKFKQAEKSLRESEERLRLATKATNDVIWDWDIVHDSHLWNEAGATVFGWSDTVEHPQNIAWWISRVHPEDRARVEKGFRTVFESRDQDHWRDEYRFLKSDGTYAFVLDRGYVMRDEKGGAVRMIGAMLDLTERKRAEAQLKALNETLEQRVAERTAEAERRADQLRQLAAEMTRAVENERRRVAHVLHDDLQQLLVAARFRLDFAGRKVQDERIAAAIREASDFVEEAIAESRSLTKELSPPVLYDAGFVAGLEWLGRETEKKYQLAVTVEAAHELEPDDLTTKVFLFQAVRELILNAVKHARASSLRICLARADDDQLQVVVEDDGTGFDPETVTRNAGEGGFGLFSIRERLDVIGGQLTIVSTPLRGTRATIVVPRRRA